MIKFLIISLNTIILFLVGIFSKADGIGISGNFPNKMQAGSEVTIELRVKKGGLGGFAKLQLEMPDGFTATDIENKGSNFNFSPGIAKWVWPALPVEDEIFVKFNLKADVSLSGSKTIGGKFSYIENNAKQVVEMIPIDIIISEETNPVSVVPETSEGGNSKTSTPPVTIPVSKNSTTANLNKPLDGLNDDPNGNINVLRYIKAGISPDEHLIEIKISKGSVKGFAKFTDELPVGYTAKSLSTSESSFSIADGKIKFVWVTLPKQEEMTISYLLTGRSASLVNLNGEFSYLANNQSKKFVMQTVTLPDTPSPEKFNVPAASSTPTKAPENNDAINFTNTISTESDSKKTFNSTENATKTITSNRSGEINYRVQIGAFNNSAVQSQTLSRKFGVKDKIISEMTGGMNKFMVGNHEKYKNARDHREELRSNINSAFVVAYNGSKRITVQEALMLTNQKWFK